MSLALVDNQLATVTPYLATDPVYSVELTTTRMMIKVDGQLLETGVTFYRLEGNAVIDPRTGIYSLGTNPGKVVFRAIFAGQHRDITI